MSKPTLRSLKLRSRRNLAEKHHAEKHHAGKRAWLGFTLLGATTFLGGTPLWTSPASADDGVGLVAHVQTAQFKIPFNVNAHGSAPVQVQLHVSVDDGQTWQTYGSVPAETRAFDFRAAAEGTYLFKVATLDATGVTFPNPGPPLKVLVDTTKPHAEVQADINEQGQLVVDIRVVDQHLDTHSAMLRIRSDHESQWRDVPLTLAHSSESLVSGQSFMDTVFAGQVIVDLAPCREVAIVFAVKDLSLNEGEASFQYAMPRTASGPRDMTLASTKHGAQPSAEGSASLPGATRWTPTITTTPQSAVALAPLTSGATDAPRVTRLGESSDNGAPGRLASDGTLSLDPLELASPTGAVEELPLPSAMTKDLTQADLRQFPTSSPLDLGQAGTDSSSPQASLGIPSEPQPPVEPAKQPVEPARQIVEPQLAVDSSTIGRAYHCKSRAFSLDYSVEALGGSALADVELWGTEDGGRQWQKWGSDPDRTSPFDVQVGNDGLFGFRMVIVGSNGIVSNRPREGDSADVWINVDTNFPAVKITRAVYGEGPEDGLLVIDYTCQDGHLVERPITLSFSERIDGPWTQIATGLTNTGIYLWKAAPSLPEKIYLKLECVDKAGNIGAHRLDLPIDVKGLAPRGIIQGFRAIEAPAR